MFKTLDQIGAPTAGFKAFAEGAGKTYNDAVQQQTFDWGVYGVPTYVLPEYPDAAGRASQFFGREHLPRIAWMLAGQQGDAPDVAYELASDVDSAALEKSASDPGVVQVKLV